MSYIPVGSTEALMIHSVTRGSGPTNTGIAIIAFLTRNSGLSRFSFFRPVTGVIVNPTGVIVIASC